jgi:hypothetical protein
MALLWAAHTQNVMAMPASIFIFACCIMNHFMQVQQAEDHSNSLILGAQVSHLMQVLQPNNSGGIIRRLVPKVYIHVYIPPVILESSLSARESGWYSIYIL